MKLYAYSKDNNYICSFDASLEEQEYKRVFKKFKKCGVIENAHLRIDDTSEKGIKEAVEKLDLLAPLEVEVYTDTIKLIRMPYPRRAGLDKVGKYITYYQADIAICSLPALYFLIFDEDNKVREDALVNIWYYLNNEWNEHIKSVYDNIALEDGYLDYNLSDDKKIELVKAFLSSLDVVLSDVSASPLNNTSESEQAFYLRDIIEKIDEYKKKTKNSSIKL